MTPTQRGLQASAASLQEQDGAPDAMQRRFEFRGPFFRTDEAAAYLQYRGKYALCSLYRFLKKNGVPTSRRFRTVLVRKADIDRAIGAVNNKRSSSVHVLHRAAELNHSVNPVIG